MTYLLIFNPITLLVIYIIYAQTYKHQNANVICKILYWAVTAIGAVVDMVVNITWATVIFWNLPKEWLLTKRVERTKSMGGKRGKLANNLCSLLNYFLPNHCR